QLDDATSITDLLRSLGWFAHMETEPPETSRERVAKHLALCLADASHSVYVAVDADGTVIGYCAIHWLPYLFMTGPEGYVSELFVREAGRGRGVGTRLLETVIEEARGRGCRRLQLVNMKHRESYQRGFYPKHGWVERPAAGNFVYLLD
ncbi:MAG TPA: GNAT family N-acetyltransferase, partial [Ardenticatenaceae bacterium]|nr:GNAT family N-acetyltransferase [Ardenticatenaceae bacterium]